jgi:hypothetical protein
MSIHNSGYSDDFSPNKRPSDLNPIVEDAPAPIDQGVKARAQQLQELADREPVLAEFLAVVDCWTSMLYRMNALEAFEAVQAQRGAGR